MTAAAIRNEIATLRRAAQAHDNRLNEGGEGFNPHHTKLARLEAALDKAAEAEFEQSKATARAAEEAEWTLLLTQQRRAAWNAWVRANSTGGTLHPAQVANQIKAQGWSLEPLKRSIARHGL